MKKKGFFDKLAGAIDPDDNRIANYGGYDVKLDSTSAEKEDSDESTDFAKDEILKLVEDYQKKDESISVELAELADNKQILAKAQELILDGKTELSKFLSEIIKADKSGDAQKVINSLTTAPEPKPEEKKEATDAPLKTTKLVIDKVAIYNYIKENPDILTWIKETDFTPKKIAVYFNKQDLKKEHMLVYDEIEAIIATVFNGSEEKACSASGWYNREYRVANKDNKPTDTVYPEPKKG